MSVSVDSSAANGSVAISTDVVVSDGAAAFDALSLAAQQSGVGVDARTTAYGVYVAGIGSLSEKQYGGSSGWLYAVNSSEPGVSASGYRLHDGDAVSWFYTR